MRVNWHTTARKKSKSIFYITSSRHFHPATPAERENELPTVTCLQHQYKFSGNGKFSRSHSVRWPNAKAVELSESPITLFTPHLVKLARCYIEIHKLELEFMTEELRCSRVKGNYSRSSPSKASLFIIEFFSLSSTPPEGAPNSSFLVRCPFVDQ